MPIQLLDTDRFLQNAREQSVEQRLDQWFVVDADAHHDDVFAGLLPYLDKPWRRRVQVQLDLPFRLVPSSLGDPLGERVKRPYKKQERYRDDIANIMQEVTVAAEALGCDRTVVFPKDMLQMGLHPQPDMEVQIARAYARYMTEEVLPQWPSLRCMLYLPFNTPEACLDLIEKYGDRPGVVGAMVTTVRYQPVYHNKFMKVYGALQERGLPLAFHPVVPWRETPFEMFNKYPAAWAYGIPLFSIVHLTNLVINGIPERFPKLRFLFLESGVSWIPFVLFRLDNEFLMRRSEAPLLKRLPSEYIRERFFFTTQPLEEPLEGELSYIEALVDMIGCSQLLFASNYPEADFDLPGKILSLPFLTDDDKRAILGGNACRLFGEERIGAPTEA